jgi:hypothetical protein
MTGTVWDIGGCTSFYIDAGGRNATLWPHWTFRFRRLASNLEPNAYELTAPAAAPAAAPVTA